MESRKQVRIKKKSSKRRRLRLIVFALLPLVIIGGYLLRQEIGLLVIKHVVLPGIEDKLEPTYQPLPNQDAKVINESEPFTVLLLGVDQRNKETGRSDTMIYSVIRPKEKKVFMVSIPRDTYVQILGTNRKSEVHDKITHAYAFGGASASIETVEGLFENRVDYYATINFKGVIDTVDTLGGLHLPITEDLINDDADHEKFVIKGGQSLYNGQDSLNYVRFREDAGGDINRTHRQVEFIKAMISRMIKLGNLSKIPNIMNSLGYTLKTDMPPEQITENAKLFLDHEDDFISSYTLPGTGGKRSNGIWYYNLDEDQLGRVKSEISRWLDPSTTISRMELDQLSSN